MKKLIKALREVRDDVDYENCQTLIDDGLFDSFHIMQSIMQIEDSFDIIISPENITHENFNSAQNMMKMIKRLQQKNE
ncbi:D-alanyl carrier protein [Campylobacter majalis]|uniref:D-alanyl carrier protein n=1 Tax=Campylobacter majalis TaxID=2790656 RepID=A0ABM8Q973_9BACT|nr:hypothetical protein [Campylobacter majalis]CAD7289348.1 D-alanyl carrier protein [Campylobacter majalis]